MKIGLGSHLRVERMIFHLHHLLSYVLPRAVAQVGSVIRQLQVSYEPEARDALFQLLQDQPEMQKRFLEFLPKHF